MQELKNGIEILVGKAILRYGSKQLLKNPLAT